MQNSGRVDEKIDFSELLSDDLRRRFDVVVLGDVDFQDVDVGQWRQLRGCIGIPTSRDDLEVRSGRQNPGKLEVSKINHYSSHKTTALKGLVQIAFRLEPCEAIKGLDKSELVARLFLKLLSH